MQLGEMNHVKIKTVTSPVMISFIFESDFSSPGSNKQKESGFLKYIKQSALDDDYNRNENESDDYLVSN